MATPLIKTPLQKKNGDWYRKKICGVYLITNTSNGMHYCGQSVDISGRWQQHMTPNKSAIGTAIAEAPQRFTFRILERCPKEMLNDREKHYIQVYDCVWPNGYNRTSGGSSGSAVSKETKKKISEGLKGKPRSEETKKKISEKLKGVPTGRHTPSTHFIEMNKSKTGIPRSEESIQKQINTLTGRKRPDHSAKLKGRRLNKETRKYEYIENSSALSDDAPYINLETDAQ